VIFSPGRNPALPSGKRRHGQIWTNCPQATISPRPTPSESISDTEQQSFGKPACHGHRHGQPRVRTCQAACVDTAVDRSANIGQAYRQFFFFVVRWQQNENHYSVSHCGIGGWPGPLNCGGGIPWHPLEVYRWIVPETTGTCSQLAAAGAVAAGSFLRVARVSGQHYILGCAHGRKW